MADEVVSLREEGCHLLVLRDRQEELAQALTGAEAAAHHRAGRGTVRIIACSFGKVVVRQALRGGLMRFLGDRYLGAPRVAREFALLRTAYQQQLPVPEALGVAWQRQGIFCRRGRIATAYIEGTDLHEWLSLWCGRPARTEERDNSTTAATPPAIQQPEDVLRATGAAIRRMHDAGIYHADLHVKNIRITPAGPVLMDFDNARFRRMSRLQRSRNLLRFRRSLEKMKLPRHYFEAVCAGYGAIEIPRWLQVAYSLKGQLSDTVRRN